MWADLPEVSRMDLRSRRGSFQDSSVWEYHNEPTHYDMVNDEDWDTKSMIDSYVVNNNITQFEVNHFPHNQFDYDFLFRVSFNKYSNLFFGVNGLENAMYFNQFISEQQLECHEIFKINHPVVTYRKWSSWYKTFSESHKIDEEFGVKKITLTKLLAFYDFNSNIIKMSTSYISYNRQFILLDGVLSLSTDRFT